MSKRKSIRISAINWCSSFEDANGSYYDYKTAIYSNSKESHESICDELVNKGWREVKTINDLTIFEQDRYIIKISELW